MRSGQWICIMHSGEFRDRRGEKSATARDGELVFRRDTKRLAKFSLPALKSPRSALLRLSQENRHSCLQARQHGCAKHAVAQTATRGRGSTHRQCEERLPFLLFPFSLSFAPPLSCLSQEKQFFFFFGLQQLSLSLTSVNRKPPGERTRWDTFHQQQQAPSGAAGSKPHSSATWRAWKRQEGETLGTERNTNTSSFPK